MKYSPTFYEAIERNRWRTFWLLLLFPIMIFSITFIAIFIISFFQIGEWTNAIFIAGNIFFEIIPYIIMGSIFWVLIAIWQGKNMILSFAEAKPIKKSDYPELFRVVENLAIRTGIPTPEIYVMEDESLNAFATGFSPNNSAVAITSGLLKKLEKNEIEAVMAHEFGHILHRDIRTMLIAITIVGIIQLIAEIILRVVFRNIRVFSAGGKVKKGGQLALILIAAGVIVWIISFLGSVFVQMGISRQREYMADAESANLTRNPNALISALQKISQDSRVEVLDGNRSLAALCIFDPLEQKKSLWDSFTGLFSSHPKVEDRIEVLKHF